MGFLRNIVKDGIGLIGKHAMNVANGATGGLAGTTMHMINHSLNANAGLIGKVARGLGRKLLSDNVRGKLSNAADKAINVLPSGPMKDALSKINNIAQGKPTYTGVKPMNHTTKTKNMRSHTRNTTFRD